VGEVVFITFVIPNFLEKNGISLEKIGLALEKLACCGKNWP
jgi:hypothetical protein